MVVISYTAQYKSRYAGYGLDYKGSTTKPLDIIEKFAKRVSSYKNEDFIKLGDSLGINPKTLKRYSNYDIPKDPKHLTILESYVRD